MGEGPRGGHPRGGGLGRGGGRGHHPGTDGWAVGQQRQTPHGRARGPPHGPGVGVFARVA